MRCIAAIFFVVALAPATRATTPASFEDLVNRATLARSANDRPRAISLYSRALLMRPNWGEGWFAVGLLQYQAGSYVAARDAMSRYIALTPGSDQAKGVRGLCELEIGEYARALEDIQGALSAAGDQELPEEQLLRYDEGLLLTRLGKFEKALQAYGWFVQRQISTEEISLAIGLAGLRMPILPKNLSANKDVVENVGSAIYEFMSGDQGSRRRFEELFERSPVLEYEHYIYGLLLFALDPDAAEKEFHDETELYPENAQGHVMMAWALLIQGRSDDALAHAVKAEAKAPGSAAARLVLGRALAETGHAKEGIEHLSEALRMEPENLEIHIALAEAYSRAGERKQSQRERRICLDMTRDGNNRVALP